MVSRLLAVSRRRPVAGWPGSTSDDLGRAKLARGKPRWVEQHADLAFGAANQRRLRHQRHLLDRIIHLRYHASEREVVIALTVKREREDRDIVDGLGLMSGKETPCGMRRSWTGASG